MKNLSQKHIITKIARSQGVPIKKAFHQKFKNGKENPRLKIVSNNLDLLLFFDFPLLIR